MISPGFPFFQPPQSFYPPPSFELFNYNPFAYGIQDAFYQSQLYKRQNPYASYDVKLPANHSQKKLKTQVGLKPVSPSNSNLANISRSTKKVQKVINLEEEGDDNDLIVIDDDDDSSALCVKDDIFKQIPCEVNVDVLSHQIQDQAKSLRAKVPAHSRESAHQRSESGYFKSLCPNSQFSLNPSGANFNSPVTQPQLTKLHSNIPKKQEPLVIAVEDDEERCDSNMSSDFGNESNLAVSILISNNEYIFANNASTQKKSPVSTKIESPELAKKGLYCSQIRIKNINISYFRPLSQLDKDTSTTGFSERDLSLGLPDNQGAVNFEDSETQSEIFTGANDKSPTAKIPALFLNKAQETRTRRAPKLIWDPKDIERDALEQFYSDLTKVTRKEITNEEVVLNSLKMNDMDITKTLNFVKHNRSIYRDLFTIKPHFSTLKK